MSTDIKNARTLRRSNKINVIMKLTSKGDISRLQLSRELGLTPASITQLVQELISEGLVVETESVQRNSTGRREVLLHFNSNKYVAVGVNIERDHTHISICSFDTVFNEEIYKTPDLIQGGNISDLCIKIRFLANNYKGDGKILGLGVSIAGIVDEKNGISLNSHGILPENYPLLQSLKNCVDLDIMIINNVKAQARALISDANDNFMLIKHSPGVGCALVVDGKVVEGIHARAGELGHTIMESGGVECDCGKRGCLEAIVSERHIQDLYRDKTGLETPVKVIYQNYHLRDTDAFAVMNYCLDLMARAVGNAAMLTDPEKIMLTGGMFFDEFIFQNFKKRLSDYGFSNVETVLIGNDKKIKAFSGAKHLLLKKLFEV